MLFDLGIRLGCHQTAEKFPKRHQSQDQFGRIGEVLDQRRFEQEKIAGFHSVVGAVPSPEEGAKTVDGFLPLRAMGQGDRHETLDPFGKKDVSYRLDEMQLVDEKIPISRQNEPDRRVPPRPFARCVHWTNAGRDAPRRSVL